ncbi:MAG: peptidase [Bryobacterales bacterium]|nr:peptidase [Bryobacterales bacterium]MDE0629818.1 peptidase [Bryobacterales bacterium]
MTFCLGINVSEGLVGIADTRLTSGNECLTARKVSVYERDGGAMFIMTSGLRSVRDKALTYFEDALGQREEPFTRLYQAVNLFTDQVRRVASEDKAALVESGLAFDMKALIGGQMRGEDAHKLYLVYPQGNWVDTGRGTPYHVIGSTGYGKPILDRTLTYNDSMRHAFKTGCLAFDSTRISAADVGFPIDAVLYVPNTFRIVEHRYQEEDLLEISNWWQERLRLTLSNLPEDWIEEAFSKLHPAAERKPGAI